VGGKIRETLRLASLATEELVLECCSPFLGGGGQWKRHGGAVGYGCGGVVIVSIVHAVCKGIRLFERPGQIRAGASGNVENVCFGMSGLANEDGKRHPCSQTNER
jgi:hypothetical protein